MLNKEEVFVFLDELRESGITNMYGAGSFIEKEFSCSKHESGKLLLEWMDTFDKRHKDEN